MANSSDQGKGAGYPSSRLTDFRGLFARLLICSLFGFAGGFLAYAAWHHGIPILGADAYGMPVKGFDITKSIVFGSLGAISALVAIFVIVAPDPDDYARLIALSAAAGIFFLPVINSSLGNIAGPGQEARSKVENSIESAVAATKPDATPEVKEAAAAEVAAAISFLDGLNQSQDPDLTTYSNIYARELLTDPSIRELLRQESTSTTVPNLGSVPSWTGGGGSPAVTPSWAVPYELDPNFGVERAPTSNSYFCQIFPKSCPSE